MYCVCHLVNAKLGLEIIPSIGEVWIFSGTKFVHNGEQCEIVSLSSQGDLHDGTQFTCLKCQICFTNKIV